MAEALAPVGPSEQQKEDQDLVTKWLKAIDRSSSHEEKWRDRGKDIVEKYRNEKADIKGTNQQFNILYANTEVKKGVMYQRTPIPDVRRRWLSKNDPAGREAAKVLEQGLTYAIDAYDFDEMIEACVQDVTLPGRGQARVKYVPTFSPVRVPLQPNAADPTQLLGPDQQPVDPAKVQLDDEGPHLLEQELVYEEVKCEYVDWEFFRTTPVKRWDKVWWVAFGEPLDRAELKKLNPQVAESVALNWHPPGAKPEDGDGKALVWMVWDKRKRQVVVLTDGYKDAPLKVLPDPLRLEGFFPCPRPMYSIWTTDSLIPVPDYVQFQEQAIELEELTERIRHLVDALRRRGVYDASFEGLRDLDKAGDNVFLPVKDWSSMTEKGGLANLWAELPIDGIAKVLLGLYDQRERVKQTIYELDGISDIMRGTTKATETLGAQELKSQYAGIRLNPRQGAVARFVRDLLRLKAEIIAEHFSVESLQAMTGIELPTAQQKAFSKQAAMQPDPMTGQPKGKDPLAEKPTWDEVMAILQSDKLRGFRVDIETDSTVKPQADLEQKNRIDLLTALTGFMEKAIPGVAAGVLPKEVAMELMLFGIRAFKVGPQLEETLQRWANGEFDQAPAGPAQNPNAGLQQQTEARTMEAGAQAAEAKAKNEQAKVANTVQKGAMPGVIPFPQGLPQ
jgi:hypothetical protein